MSEGDYEEILGETEAMVQRSVDYWRKSDEDYAEYYIDAYRCVQKNIETIKKEIIQSLSESAKKETK